VRWRRGLVLTVRDVRSGLVHLFLNTFGGAPLTPRAVRYVVYRLGGVRTQTANIADGCRLRGRSVLTIGSGTFVNRECYIEAAAPVRIGRDCHLAMQVMIITSTHDEAGGRVGRVRALPVVLGDRCWLGARVTVLPGVTIGDDVVVAAGAVVSRDCPGPGRYGGVPARPLRRSVPE
jgi:maltose O-acetyltransferase